MWLASGKEPKTVASALQSLAGLRRRYVGYDAEQTEYLAKLALEHLKSCFIREWSHGGRYELRTEMQWEASCYSRTLMNLVDDSRCGQRTFQAISKDDALPLLLKLLGDCKNPSMAILALCDYQRLLHRMEVSRWFDVRAPDGSHDKLQAGKFIKRTPAVENMRKIVETLTRYTKGDIFLHPFAIEIAVETMGFSPLPWIDAVSMDKSMENLLLPLLRLQFATREGGLSLRKSVASTLAIFANIHAMPRDADPDEDFAKRFEESLSIIASMEIAETSEDLARELLLQGLAHFAGTEYPEGSVIQVGLIFESLFHETDRRTGNEDPWYSDSATVTSLLPLLYAPNLRDDYKEKILTRLQANAVSAAPGHNLSQDSFLLHITPKDPFPPDSVDILLSTLIVFMNRTVGWLRDVSVLLRLISTGAVHRTRLMECTQLVMEIIQNAALEDSSKYLFWIYSRALRDYIAEPLGEIDTVSILFMLDFYDKKHGLSTADAQLWVEIIPQLPISADETMPRRDLVRDLLANFQLRTPERLETLSSEREVVLGEAPDFGIPAVIQAMHRLEISYIEGLEVKDIVDERIDENGGYTYPPTSLLPMYEVNPFQVRQ